MFSPADSSIIAVAVSNEGSELYDIRNLYSCLYSFPSKDVTCCARFNGSGTRLLCYEGDQRLVVYDLPVSRQDTGDGILCLAGPHFSNQDVGRNSCCFAGSQDELVIGAADDNSLFIWLLPDFKGQECTVNRPLHSLTGHGETNNCIRYNRGKSAVVSCDDDGIIKLWTANAPR